MSLFILLWTEFAGVSRILRTQKNMSIAFKDWIESKENEEESWRICNFHVLGVDLYATYTC